MRSRFHSFSAGWGLALVCAASIGCSDSGEPCEGPNGPCIELSPGSADDHSAIQSALLDAQPGDVIFLRAGTYQVGLGLSLTVSDVTLRGAGQDDTVLDFSSQVDGAQGLLVTADGFTVEDLAVVDTVGDGIKVEGSDRVVFRRTRVEWTGSPSSDNGAYGLYPVQCQDVVIEDSLVTGASDAGIYVGQSNNIIVRRNRVERNVAGIEIENSFDADVYENLATDNTGGVLVFNLPGLPVQNGARIRVFDNQLIANNWPNFAPEGNIVGLVPQGTGLAALAAHEVEIFGNRFEDNQTVNTGVISYYMTQREFDDPDYDPYSDTLYIHDNEYIGGGDRASGELGFALLAALGEVKEAPIVVPDIVWDGIMDPAKVEGDGLAPAYNLCIQNNGDADYAYLDAENEFAGAHLDASAHDCSHMPLEPVTIAGIEP